MALATSTRPMPARSCAACAPARRTRSWRRCWSRSAATWGSSRPILRSTRPAGSRRGTAPLPDRELLVVAPRGALAVPAGVDPARHGSVGAGRQLGADLEAPVRGSTRQVERRPAAVALLLELALRVQEAAAVAAADLGDRHPDLLHVAAAGLQRLRRLAAAVARAPAQAHARTAAVDVAVS